MNVFFCHINPQLLVYEEKGEKQQNKDVMLLKPETVLTLIYSNNVEILDKVEEPQIDGIVKYLTEND